MSKMPGNTKTSGAITTGSGMEWTSRVKWLAAIAIGIVTWVVLCGCLDNQFTDWDDAGYIVNNPIVKDISPAGLRHIFTEPVMGNYHPVTILSYALEYSMVELDPWLYHFDSLLLHVLATIAVYWFVVVLTKKPVAAIITALLFGLSPMHVESAAWVAGRKDLFCTLFYMLACIAYVSYIRATDKRKNRDYGLVLVFFLLAVLSKPVAVTLPVTLLLIDYYEHGALTVRSLIQKIPFFVVALVFGIVSVTIQHDGGAMAAHKVDYSIIERTALAGYALVTYLWKAVLPVGLRVYYPYPAKGNDAIPTLYYAALLIFPALFLLVWKYWRTNRMVVFGLSFFLVNIALLLQFIPVGDVIVAERYSYTPYIGLFFIPGMIASRYMDGDKYRNIILGIFAAFLLFFAVASYGRVRVWHDPISLWTDEIDKEPVNAPIAYNNLGFIYFNRKNMATDPAQRQIAADSAYYMMGKAVEIKPDMVNALQGLGMLAYMKGDFPASLGFFRQAIRYEPTADNYGDYANVLLQVGQRDSALMYYDKAVATNADVFNVRMNRARLLRDMNRSAEIKADVDKAISLSPVAGEAYYLRAFYYAGAGDKNAARQDVEKAISLGFQQIDNNFYQGLK